MANRLASLSAHSLRETLSAFFHQWREDDGGYLDFQKKKNVGLPKEVSGQESVKQVIVVNESLKLPRGKLAAQVAHAAIAAFLAAGKEARRLWLAEGMPKVILKGQTADELRELEYRARQRGIPAALIADAGRTVVAAGTLTCVGLGPAQEQVLDGLTGELTLVR